jgi:SAM-dependent methyltransferase
MTSSDGGRKTDQAYWEALHSPAAVRMRLPSPLNVSTLNFMRLLRRSVRPGMSVLEIGFAPGKNLAWVGKRLGARVAGIDYSTQGVEVAKELFRALDLAGDLRCEDVFETTFAPGSFDLVYSLGVIEHFDDPRDIVARHVSLVRPDGGTALIVIPNYGGPYGTLQRFFDPATLDIHNLEIMNLPSLSVLGRSDSRVEVRTFPFGRIAPALVSWSRRMPPRAAFMLHHALNIAALLQPVDIRPVCPWLALELRRVRA